jgi:predicted secreted Zn-dependent protease
MKLSYIIYFLFFCILQCKSQKIDWTNSGKISWLNYKSKPDTISKFSASSNIGIKYDLKRINDTIYLSISCYFNSDSSWVKHNCKSKELLRHEWTHFDIAEYYRRLFIKTLSDLYFFRDSALEEIDKLYFEILAKRSEYDNSYDADTEYHINTKKQIMWSKNIEILLNQLKNYTGSDVKILLH